MERLGETYLEHSSNSARLKRYWSFTLLVGFCLVDQR